MTEIVNIAAYQFVTLDRLPERRGELLERCRQLGLKGTILLSPEGINCFLAGTREAIDEFLDGLRARSEFADLEVKESLCDRQPFSRMLVRIKQEIIAFGVEGIEPAKYTSPRVSATELKQWLDEGRDVTLVDTRNDYEYEIGTFDNALKLDLKEFRNFPEVVGKLPTELKEKTLVTFCTGGIRCEKAAPYMESVGFKHVYQLDGGILKYFEECGGAHYDGECFVFDQRVGVDPELNETDTTACFVCQATLTKEDCASPKYVPGQACPYCHQKDREKAAALGVKRTAELVGLVKPLPGSEPYENRIPMSVPEKLDRATAIDFLVGMKTARDRDQWLQLCSDGRLQMKGLPVEPGQIVRAGMRVELVSAAAVEPDVNPDVQVLFEDHHIVVLDKPAPLPMHPCGRFNRNSLRYFLELLYPHLKVRPAHRLDANTSGIVVCAKNRKFARELQPQFERGEVTKTYLARVHGLPPEDEFESRQAISREPVAAGGRSVDPNGLPAHTRFVVRERMDDECLLEVTPLTGRTNQIRLHLWDLGFPIVGDLLYLRDRKTGTQQTLSPADPPMCLRAQSLRFRHPGTGEFCEIAGAPPDWA